MDKQLTKEETAIIFAMYYGAKYKYKNEYGLFTDKVEFGHHTHTHIAGNAKLLLKSLSSITDEDAIEVAKMMPKGFKKDALSGKNWLEYMKLELLGYQYYQFLISRGYSVPLWFGIDHWANGKTAIELNIAIESDNTKQG